MMMDEQTLTLQIKEYARAAGFDSVGITSAEPFSEDRRIAEERIEAGHYSGLSWFTAERAAFAASPSNLLPTARSIISLAMSYRPDAATPSAGERRTGPRGRVSSYAWGRDYHDVLKERMNSVVDHIRLLAGEEQEARTLVDTARIMDRAVARRAGVGWVGKNTNIITKEAGSWVFLGEIVTELELISDAPLRAHCGSCTRCIDVCPTGAIVAPYTIQSDRCISYLTIEHRGPIPRDLRPLMGDWIYGCDLCQEVCPPNRRVGARAHEEFQPADRSLAEAAAPELIPLLTITPEEFRTRFGGTPVKRAKREGLQRNVAVALGNSGDRGAVPALATALRGEAPLVRGHAAWALGRLGGDEAHRALVAALETETDATVREEIDRALEEYSAR